MTPVLLHHMVSIYNVINKWGGCIKIHHISNATGVMTRKFLSFYREHVTDAYRECAPVFGVFKYHM